MLQKASATVELMIGDSKVNMPNQAVTGNFMTIMLELTPDLITQLEKQEKKVTGKISHLAKGHDQVVLKILKPSGNFYTKLF